MKRCPTCNRIENDDTLVFCRADGTPLVSDSGSVSADAGTVRFGSSPVASEVETSMLPRTVTDADMSRPTGPTTVLDRQQAFRYERQFDRAIEQYKKTLEIDANFPPAREDLAVAYAEKGAHEEAVTEMNKTIALAGRLPVYVAELGYIYAVAGTRPKQTGCLRS